MREEQNADARLLEQLEEATAQLADAVVALQTDRLAFPDAVTGAQGAWLDDHVRARRALTP